jgi:AraC-like DNA-binding protein
MTFNAESRPCYAARLLKPFGRLLRRDGIVIGKALDRLDALEPDARVPVEVAHELLAGAVHLTGKPHIGLEAAREIGMGELGVLMYAATSASSIRDALSVAMRFTRLLRDGTTATLQVEGDRAVIRFTSDYAMPAAAEDYELAAFHFVMLPSYATSPHDYDVSFVHAPPLDRAPYEQAFVGARLHFQQGERGFAFNAQHLDEPLRSTDPGLHAVLREHAERLLSELPRAEATTARAREVLMHELRSGQATATRVAKALAMSERTLARRLEAEGTTMRELLHDLRRTLAVRYLTTTDLQASEIALLLGFASGAAFSLAFKRWTQKSPLEYRRRHRG